MVVADAFACVERTGERYYEAELHRIQGELLLLSEPDARRADAEACFHRALEVARRQQARSLELRAATSLARFWLDDGRAPEARTLLAPIYDRFAEGLELPDLRDAHTLLAVTTGPT